MKAVCMPGGLLSTSLFGRHRYSDLTTVANMYQTITSNYVKLIVPKRANSFAHLCGT